MARVQQAPQHAAMRRHQEPEVKLLVDERAEDLRIGGLAHQREVSPQGIGEGTVGGADFDRPSRRFVERRVADLIVKAA